MVKAKTRKTPSEFLSNKGIATRSDRTLLGAPGLATRSDRTLLGAPAAEKREEHASNHAALVGEKILLLDWIPKTTEKQQVWFHIIRSQTQRSTLPTSTFVGLHLLSSLPHSTSSHPPAHQASSPAARATFERLGDCRASGSGAHGASRWEERSTCRVRVGLVSPDGR